MKKSEKPTTKYLLFLLSFGLGLISIQIISFSITLISGFNNLFSSCSKYKISLFSNPITICISFEAAHLILHEDFKKLFLFFVI